MAFKRNNFSSLVNTRKEYFASAYKFSKKVDFKVGSDAYIIPLGLEAGFYETPCHRVQTHKVDGKLIGFNGSSFPVYIKCDGMDAEGNRDESALCCTLAKMEKERIPDKNDSGKRIISFVTSRIHLPVLVLGNSLSEDNKISYPVSKVSILKDLHSEGGLKFAFLDMSANTFQQDIVLAYGKKLKEDGVLDYELSEDSEEFMEEVRQRLSQTIIKIHGVAKQGFNAAMKEYSFFPFDNKAIAAQSDAGERDAIVGYQSNAAIMKEVEEFMTLFDSEVDNLVQSWNAKDLQEYYNSAIGVDLKAPLATEEEEVEVITTPTKTATTSTPVQTQPAQKAPVAPAAPVEDDMPVVGKVEDPVSDEELEKIMADPFADTEDMVDEAPAAPVAPAAKTPVAVAAKPAAKISAVDELDEIEYDMDTDDFFTED